jgi:beta-galactosidase/beta-glucuronidase
MYVVDEANIETHGMKPMGRLAHDWGWENTFVSRVRRMVQRDWNHASIIMWSLGNEAGRGRNMTLARKAVLDLDTSRPICYESGKYNIGGRSGRLDVAVTYFCALPEAWTQDIVLIVVLRWILGGRRGEDGTDRHCMSHVSKCGAHCEACAES